ncbi:hypothetical protein [Arenimonas fontis]|uniref:Uncharacterized protein n=1 Tax=Arenimonas fontis TaxID=2608255 RepID=A0A5B2ZD16_9GAMM|nr:hypothetical protein [Arenimonas fontis]KAA2284961.1 hypothetical protein F0415_06850 [Arenimonas fontis]
MNGSLQGVDDGGAKRFAASTFGFRQWPEVAGLFLGLSDAIPRLIVSAFLEPGDGFRLFGPLALARVHHREWDVGYGLTSTHAALIFAVFCLVAVLMLRLAMRLLRKEGSLSRLALFALAAAMGVAMIDFSETVLTGKVTEYLGLIRGSRISLFNLGDLMRWAALLFVPMLAVFGLFRVVAAQFITLTEEKA